MPAFIVATVVVDDATAFGRYTDAIAGLHASFGGEYVVRGPVTGVLEGGSPSDERVVVLRFPNERAARDYVASDAYRSGAAHRAGAASVDMRLVVVAD